MYPYGLIGNCQIAALVGQTGSIDWLCVPRPDSPPVFGRLLDLEGGHFAIQSATQGVGEQTYLPNTNILVTVQQSADGSAFKITDFCPRFEQHGRIYRPVSLLRIVERVSGNPLIRVECNPVKGWEKTPLVPIRGNSHIRFEMGPDSMRLMTNMPLTYLLEKVPFRLENPLYFVLAYGAGIEDDLPKVAKEFLERTHLYWRTWVQHCSIPSQYQKETIRSALALKLHCYEDTGAILAALTTSLPEERGCGRNWDYRYCWLRDSYFVLSAFHRLGQFEEMEGFLKYFLNIAYKHEHSRERLCPVYALDQSLPLPEVSHKNWEGHEGCEPVRSGNQAAQHIQNDVYGEMILTLAPIFFDERFRHLRTPEHEELVENLVRSCVHSISQPDAGLWEFRDGWREHSFSNLMHWAGIDRVMEMQSRGFVKSLEVDLARSKTRAENAIRSAIIRGSIRNGPTDPSFESAMLQLPLLRFPDRELCLQTTQEVARELCMGADGAQKYFLYRYRRSDDFGLPQSSFLVCSFWLAQALARLSQTQEAGNVMNSALEAANPLGLFSEHYLPSQHTQYGNFPQAYSHVGLINAAFEISPPWMVIL